MPLFRRRNQPGAAVDDASKAMKDAHANLRRVKSRSSEVTEVANRLRVLRERNHFVEQLETIMEGPR